MAAILVPSASAAPLAVDVQLDLTVAISGGPASSRPVMQVVTSGGTATFQSRTFVLGVDVSLVTPEAATATLRYELPPGLTWGDDAPDPSEHCTSTPTTAECQTPMLEPTATAGSTGWAWDVVAAAPGSYVVRAKLLQSSPLDAHTANDSSSITIVVSDAVSATTISAGAATLTPTRPRAGSAFAATVRVTVGGLVVFPTGVRCSAAIGATKIRGVGERRAGSVRCGFRTPASARGKTIRGSVSFVTAGRRITRQFSAKLR